MTAVMEPAISTPCLQLGTSDMVRPAGPEGVGGQVTGPEPARTPRTNEKVWAAIKELELSYHEIETLSLTISTCYGNLN